MLDRTERQEQGIEKWINNRCRGTLCWATGTGKTRAGILAVTKFFNKNPNKKVVVVVPTDVLQKQWIKLLADAGFIFNIEVLIINTAASRPFICDFLIIDEVHRAAADLFSKVFQMANAKMILGLTATFDRLDGKHQLIAKYCPVVDTITVKQATDNGWLSEYKEYKVFIDVDDIHVYNEYNQEFLNHFSFFNFDFDLAMKCITGIKKNNRIVESAESVRKRYAIYLLGGNLSDSTLIKNTIKEVSAHAFAWQRALKARKDFVMNHPKKIEITKLILDYRQNSKAILFTSSIKQSDSFKNIYTVHSGKTKKKNQLSLEEFSNLETGVIASSKMLTEGLDVKGLNLAIILHNTSSATERIQKIGRVIRKEKGKQAEVFSLIIRNTMELQWFKKSSKNLTSIEINESELLELLQGKKLNKSEKVQEEVQFLFTF